MQSVRRIGLAVDAVASYGRGVIRGIVSYTRTHPHLVIAVEPLWSFGTLPPVREWEVDGLIVQVFSRDFEADVLKAGLPAVNVSNILPESSLTTIVPDDSAIGELAAEHLLRLGFRELGYCWPGDNQYGKLRLQAFSRKASDAGAHVHVWGGSGDLRKWLIDLPKPAAVLGCNDDWAHRVLNHARTAGIAVPDQLAVMGVDDDELFNTLVTPSLSSIAVPGIQIGYKAAEELDKLLSTPLPPDSVAPIIRLAPLRLVLRESTDVLSIADQEVVSAMRFIRERTSRPMLVDDVADGVALSRRSLERRFRKSLGHSISDEIHRVHVERAKQLLTAGDLSMAEVARGAGFSSATRLGIVFRKVVGQTPTAYRKRARQGQQK